MRGKGVHVLYLDYDGVLHHSEVWYHARIGPYLPSSVPDHYKLFVHLGLLEELLQPYRGQALEHGYVLKSGMVASKALCKGLATTYGNEFLDAVGCAMSARRPWPAQMLRPEIPCAYASAKHLILSAYLEHAPDSPPEVAAEYRKPGRRPTDFSALDAKTVERLKLQAKLMKERHERKSVRCLLKDAAAWELFRHNRERFPLTSAFLTNFRGTDQSERQVGGREYWRARHPQRYGLNSGPQA